MDKQILEEGSQIQIQFEKRGGLVPVVVQEVKSNQILMLGYANQEAFQQTLETGLATFYSTSRKEIWTKGKTSGDLLKIHKILTDCDQDALIYQVEMLGKGACHTKNEDKETRTSCFYREEEKGSWKLIK
ncbi:MAG: phosphoribosyl-AMP cyclohydrolase [Arenicella sp.]|jgi:phosphoribosyl-AMP cyclohydrolase